MQAKPTIEAVAMLGRPVSTAYADGVPGPGPAERPTEAMPTRRRASEVWRLLDPAHYVSGSGSSGLLQETSAHLTSDVDRTAAIAQQSSRQN